MLNPPRDGDFEPSGHPSALETESTRIEGALPATSFRVAIVTAYYNEPRHFLDRCLASVRNQTVAADHILVADGLPQDWLDKENVRHIRLDKSHGDYGNTPRGVGSLLAIAEDYDAIGFLDADNWLCPNHVELGLAFGNRGGETYDFVIAQRAMMRPDETEIPIADEPVSEHVDTNCLLFFPGAFHTLLRFSVIPKQLSAIGDRLFYANLKTQNLRSTIIPVKTVNYHCLWSSIYAAVGEAAPPDGKPNIDQGPMIAWLNGLSHGKRIVAVRRAGLPTG